jgi:flagellar P-ring protein precursor FlgI
MSMKALTILALWTWFLPVAIAGPPTRGTRLKDLVSFEGVRDNQLMGYGVVVGLAGTGDRRQTVFSAQSLANILARMGVTVSPAAIRVNNTAAVMITATLPAFAQPGTRIDITAAAVGDCSSLQGGLLLMTSLRAADGQVYAVAQGPIVINGFAAKSGSGTSVAVNHPTVGRLPNGAIVERAGPSVAHWTQVRLQLLHADFSTAARVQAALNQHFGTLGTRIAKAENSALVIVEVPKQRDPIDFIAEIESITVEADRPARVVVNERTGTIVMGKEVRISPVAILHGNLSVEIQTSFQVSQPAPLAQGQTQVVPQTTVGAKEEKARNLVLGQGATVEELVRALGSIGSTPRDVIAILQNLHRAGALEAELEVI